VRQLKEQLHSQRAQFAEEVRQLKEHAAQVNLALDEARRLRQSMSSSLSWKLTAPLRVLRDATAASLRKVKRLHSDRRSSTQKETPLFDARWYLEHNPDVQAAGTEPLLHYLEHGWKQGRSPHPLFDTKWYLDHNPDVQAAGVEPLGHYIEYGWKAERSPHPLLGAKCHLERNPTVAAAGAEPLKHHLDHGWKDRPEAHPLYPLFDPAWYLEQNPEVASAGLDPFHHYISRGWREGSCPGPLFDSVWYLKAYQDVADAGMEPLNHYLQHGIREGRFPRSIDKELAELADQNFARWASEHCTCFLSQTREKELGERLRKTAIKDLSAQKLGLVTIAGKPSDELAPGTKNSILKQAGLK
jgi:hypothetical protein